MNWNNLTKGLVVATLAGVSFFALSTARADSGSGDRADFGAHLHTRPDPQPGHEPSPRPSEAPKK
jgi:hypothetical protein